MAGFYYYWAESPQTHNNRAFDEKSINVYINSMKKKSALIILTIILVLSCASGPQPVISAPPAPVEQPAAPAESAPPPEAPPPLPPAPPVVEAPPAPAFDPANVTEELYETTKADVQAFIGELNRIIRAKNYNAWRAHLAESYFEMISSGSFLEERTEDLYKRDQIVASNLGRDPKRVQKKILRTPKDYFDNVVVPSRSNDRMDDIDFITENQVKAYTIDNRGNRLVLYDLEYLDGNWMIVN